MRDMINVPAAISPAMVSTSFDIVGSRVVRSFGLVRGITVRSRSIIGNFVAGLQILVGGTIGVYTQLCERARAEALDICLRHAAALGANAVIGLRYDANEVAGGVTEVLAYGTAVSVEPA
jgi:uncharacterized protein YbjQ (UPF0145 family)